MSGITSVGMRAVVVFLLSPVWMLPSHAADPGEARLKEEVSRQEKIYRSEGDKTVEGYTVDRSLVIYTQGLSFGFDSALANLGPTDRWLDIGAGEAQAILDYYTEDYDLAHWEGRQRRGKKARAVAMSIEDLRTARWKKTAASLERNQIRYLLDKRLREYSAEELGQFQLITDVIGGFSYTADLSLFMEKVLGVLVVNGSFFSILQDVHREDGTNRPFYKGSPFLTEIGNADGSELKVCAWLKRIACAEVTCESREWQPPVEAFHVRKVCNDVRVPTLTPIHYQAGTPPERRFRLEAN